MRRDDVALLWVQGSCSLTYWCFWSCESTAGWHASPEELDRAEQEESTSWLRTCENPLLWALDNGCKRKVRKRNCFFEGTPVRILRVALGVIKEQEMECQGCHLTQRTLGFAGNRKNGGAHVRSARMVTVYIYIYLNIYIFIYIHTHMARSFEAVQFLQTTRDTGNWFTCSSSSSYYSPLHRAHRPSPPNVCTLV